MPLLRPPTCKRFLLAATILASPLILAVAVTPLIVGAPTSAAAQAALVISVQVAPPVLPVYSQPALPGHG